MHTRYTDTYTYIHIDRVIDTTFRKTYLATHGEFDFSKLVLDHGGGAVNL